MRFAYITDPEITYYRRVMKGISHFVKSHGDIELRVRQIHTAAEFKGFDDAGYDGLIVGTFWEKSEQAARLTTPTISVSNTHAGLKLPKVVSDDHEVGAIAARHLLAKGYRHLAFWGQNPEFSEQRWRGFAATVIVALGPSHVPERRSPRPSDNRRWLARMPRPLGLFASTDAMGSDAIELAGDLGWRIPEDLAVVGVDDDDFYSELTDPPLSSVALQPAWIGFLAAKSLLELISGKEIPPVTLVPPGPMIERESSSGMVLDDKLVTQAMRYVQENLSRRVDVDDVAGALGVSRRLLQLHFKKALGQTPMREISRLRLERAQGLLATSMLPFKQVAKLSGFGRGARFSEAFMRATGQTPSQYRQQFTLS